MKNNHKPLSSIIALVLGTTAGFISSQAQAITVGNILTIAPGVTTCVNNDCENYGWNVTVGSWFAMDGNANNTIQGTEKVATAGHNGIVIGTVQGASGSHSGAPFGSGANYTNGTLTESPGINEPWYYYGNTGMHLTDAPVMVISSGIGTAVLDFSGWGWTWNGIQTDLGRGAWGAGFTNGQAKMTCSSAACTTGDTYSLDYSATGPLGDLAGWGGVQYKLHLTGTINAVPVPGAVWLLGSGLLGLLGTAGRRKAR